MPSASFSASAPISNDNMEPLVFKWEVQYMVETSDFIEANIKAKEIEMLMEYENYQARPLVTNPFWDVCILLTRDILEKAQMAHGINESLDIIRSG